MNKITTIETMEGILNEINKTSMTNTSVIASRDGLLICSTLSEQNQAQTLAAMSATMIGAAEIVTNQLGKSVPDRVVIESKNGTFIGTGAGPKALLLVTTGPEINLGLILIEMKKASERIKEVLE